MCLTLLLTTSFFAVDFSSRHPKNTQIQQVVYDLSRHNWYFFQVKKIYSFAQWRSNVRVGLCANIPKKYPPLVSLTRPVCNRQFYLRYDTIRYEMLF